MQNTQLLLHEPNKTCLGFLCDLTLSWKRAYEVPGNLGGGGRRRLYTGKQWARTRHIQTITGATGLAGLGVVERQQETTIHFYHG